MENKLCLSNSKDVENILSAIDDAKREITRAREMFDLFDNPKMIDYCIYMEDAAKARYVYFLCEAKKNGIKVEDDYFAMNLQAI